MKKCTKCGEKKPTSGPNAGFGTDRSAKDNLMSRCKDCNRKAARQHYDRNNGDTSERFKHTSTLFNYIKRLKKDGWKLKDIAAEVGLDESSISYYLNGKRQVGMQAVRKFREAKERRK